MISVSLLCFLCHFGEKQSVCLRRYLGLLKSPGNILDGSGRIGFIHIGLIHEEGNVTVMGKSERNIFLNVVALDVYKRQFELCRVCQ